MFSKINIFKNNENKYSLSIIIPTYNVEDYIRTCLDSIFKQSLENFEVICVDDCSTDSTIDILKEYQSKYENMLILENDSNHGPGYSRNKAIDVAKGEYITFFDSDDWIDNDLLGYLYKNAHDNDLDLLFSKLINYEDETGEYYKTDNYSLTILNDFENKIFNYHDLHPNMIYSISVTPPGKLYRRSVLIENNIRFLEDKFYEDNVFFNEVLFNSKRVSVVDKYTYTRRIRSGSVMQDNGEKLIDIISIMEQLLKNLLKNKEDYEKLHKVLLNYIISIIYKRFLVIEPVFSNKYYNKFKDLIKRCITEYNIHDDFMDSLEINNLNIYEMCVKSLDSNNEKIKKIQDSIELDPVLTVVYDSNDQTDNEIRKTINSILIQKFGLINLEIILIDNDNASYLLKEFEETFANIKVIDIKNENKYLESLENVSLDFVIFINKEIDDEIIDKQFKDIRIGNKNMVLPISEIESVVESHDQVKTEVEEILFKSEFINDPENFTIENGVIRLDPIIYLNSTYDIKLPEIFENNLEDEKIESYNNIIESIRSRFIRIDPKKRDEFFEEIKEFITTIITEYNYKLFISNLNKSNKEFTDLVVKSIISNNENIKKIQEEIQLDIPVCVIIYVYDNPKNELKNILNSIIRQSFGFEHIKILFIDNNSENKETTEALNKFNEIYYNTNFVRINYSGFSQADAYNIGLDNNDCKYVMFTNKKHQLTNSAIKNIFKSIRKGNMHMAIGKVQNETDLPKNTIFTNIIKYEFIKDRNIRFEMDENNNVVLNNEVLKLNGIIEEDIPVVKR